MPVNVPQIDIEFRPDLPDGFTVVDPATFRTPEAYTPEEPDWVDRNINPLGRIWQELRPERPMPDSSSGAKVQDLERDFHMLEDLGRSGPLVTPPDIRKQELESASNPNSPMNFDRSNLDQTIEQPSRVGEFARPGIKPPEGFEVIPPQETKPPEGFEIIRPESPGLGRLGINPFSSAGSGPSQWGPEKTVKFFKDQVLGLLDALETLHGAGDINSRIEAARKLEINPEDIGLFSGKEAEAGANIATQMALGTYGQAGRFVPANEGLSLFGGIKAKGKQGLELAKEYADNGAPMESIRKVTGWEYLDGKWTFEFSDKDMRWRRGMEPGHYGMHNLEDVISHSELFKYYPEARKIPIALTDMEGGSFVTLPDGSPLIKIDRNAIGTQAGRKTIVEEVQHYLQNLEGFPEGADPTRVGWENYIKSKGENRAKAAQNRIDLTNVERMRRSPELDEPVPREFQVDTTGSNISRSTDYFDRLKGLQDKELLPLLKVRVDSRLQAIKDEYSKVKQYMNRPDIEADYYTLIRTYGEIDKVAKALSKTNELDRPHIMRALEWRMQLADQIEASLAEKRGQPFMSRDEPQMTGQELREAPADERMLGTGGTRPEAANDLGPRIPQGMEPQISQEPQASDLRRRNYGRVTSTNTEKRIGDLVDQGNTIEQILEIINNERKEKLLDPISYGTVQRRVKEYNDLVKSMSKELGLNNSPGTAGIKLKRELTPRERSAGLDEPKIGKNEIPVKQAKQMAADPTKWRDLKAEIFKGGLSQKTIDTLFRRNKMFKDYIERDPKYSKD